MIRKLTPSDPAEYPTSWYAHSAPLLAPYSALEGEIDTDVCVIGGGYTGLSTALHLRERGYDVAVEEFPDSSVAVYVNVYSPSLSVSTSPVVTTSISPDKSVAVAPSSV